MRGRAGPVKISRRFLLYRNRNLCKIRHILGRIQIRREPAREILARHNLTGHGIGFFLNKVKNAPLIRVKILLVDRLFLPGRLILNPPDLALVHILPGQETFLEITLEPRGQQHRMHHLPQNLELRAFIDFLFQRRKNDLAHHIIRYLGSRSKTFFRPMIHIRHNLQMHVQ